MRILALWICFVVVLLPITAAACLDWQDYFRPEHLVPLPGSPVDMQLEGNLGYVVTAHQGYFVVVDFSDPGAPQVIFSHYLASSTNRYSLTVADGIAYVLDPYRLKTFDVSDSANIALLAEVTLVGDGLDCDLADDILYIASSEPALTLYDVSDPADPVEIGSLDTGGVSLSIQVDDGLLYLGHLVGDQGLQIYDIAAAPSLTQLGQVFLPSPINDLVLNGTDVLAACGLSGLQVIDAADPALPAVVAQIDEFFSVSAVALNGDLACINTGHNQNGLALVDLSVPHAPETLGHYSTAQGLLSYYGIYGLAMSLDGDQGYFGVYDGLLTLDLSNPILAPITGRTDVFPSTQGFTSCAGEFFASADDELIRLDLSEPTHPEAEVWVDFGMSPYGDLGKPEAGEDYLYVPYFFQSPWSEDVGLHMVDPVTGTILSSFEAFGFIGIAMAVEGDRAYLKDGLDQIWIFDLSDPHDLTWIAEHQGESDYMDDLAIRNGQLYVATTDGFAVLDASDPQAVTELLRITLEDRADAMTVAGNHLYIVERDFGLRIYDLTLPSAPVLLSSLALVGTGSTIHVDRGVAYCSTPHGLVAVDVVDPAQPIYRGILSLDRGVRHSFVIDENLMLLSNQRIATASPQCADLTSLPEDGAASMHHLRMPYPNPFNPSLTLPVRLERETSVLLRIFDVSGRRVATLAEGRFSAGTHGIEWDGRDDMGRDQPSGVYLAKLRAGNTQESRRVVLLR